MSEWISVKKQGNPTEYTEAWVYTEDGRVEDDCFYPDDAGVNFTSNVYDGIRTSDGWYQNGTNDEGKKVIYYMPIEPPIPPAPPKEVEDVSP